MQGQFESVGPVGDGYRFPHAQPDREFLFECGDFRSQDIMTALQHARNGRIDLGLRREIGRLRISGKNFVHRRKLREQKVGDWRQTG